MNMNMNAARPNIFENDVRKDFMRWVDHINKAVSEYEKMPDVSKCEARLTITVPISGLPDAYKDRLFTLYTDSGWTFMNVVSELRDSTTFTMCFDIKSLVNDMSLVEDKN